MAKHPTITIQHTANKPKNARAKGKAVGVCIKAEAAPIKLVPTTMNVPNNAPQVPPILGNKLNPPT